MTSGQIYFFTFRKSHGFTDHEGEYFGIVTLCARLLTCFSQGRNEAYIAARPYMILIHEDLTGEIYFIIINEYNGSLIRDTEKAKNPPRSNAVDLWLNSRSRTRLTKRGHTHRITTSSSNSRQDLRIEIYIALL
jgi:hypothetical protein